MTAAQKYVEQLQVDLGLDTSVAWPNFTNYCERDEKVISFAALYILAGALSYSEAMQVKCTRCTKEFQSDNISLDCLFVEDELITDRKLRSDRELYNLYDNFTS